MPLRPEVTLAELVTARPTVASRLDRLGLDYCCGGQRRLDDAVAEAGLDLEVVIAGLEAVDPPDAVEDWTSMGIADLVAHIETTHHAYLHEELPRLAALANKVATVHRTRHAELAEVRALVHALRLDLEPHLLREETVLFPIVRALADAAEPQGRRRRSLDEPIEVMRTEHDEVGDLLSRLRAATTDFAVPSDGCASYRALYDGLAVLEADSHLHVHKENNLLFPAVRAAEEGRSS